MPTKRHPKKEVQDAIETVLSDQWWRFEEGGHWGSFCAVAASVIDAESPSTRLHRMPARMRLASSARA